MYLIIIVVMGRCIGAFLPIRSFSSYVRSVKIFIRLSA